MLDKFQPVLKIVCLALAALLLLEVARRVAHPDPLGNASVPPLPTLSAPTNAPAHADAKPKDTNVVAKVKLPKSPRHHGNMMPPFGGHMTAADLPPAIQARIDRIKESGILGPFMRPPPLALLGIADDDAFIRAPDGQSGLVKEGGELGGIKLLRIGINRVLIEQDGEKKELTLFDGFGSESLMPKASENPTNATNTPHQKDNP